MGGLSRHQKKGTFNICEMKLLVKPEIQIQAHIAGCSKCGSRTAHLFLSTQQREAISRQHHLKFIIGHYGSGKVYFFADVCTVFRNIDSSFSDNGWTCYLRTRVGQIRERAEVLHLLVKEQQWARAERLGSGRRECYFLEQK